MRRRRRGCKLVSDRTRPQALVQQSLLQASQHLEVVRFGSKTCCFRLGVPRHWHRSIPPKPKVPVPVLSIKLVNPCKIPVSSFNSKLPVLGALASLKIF